MTRILTFLSGLLALTAVSMAFYILPADLSMPITWLLIPFYGGAVFVNAFGLAAILLMVPWEIVSDSQSKRRQLHVLSQAEHTSGEIACTSPVLTNDCIAEPLVKQIA